MRHPPRPSAVKLLAVIGTALVLAACSSDPPPAPHQLPPVKHAPAQRIADPNDEKAVLATLDGINPCSLVDVPKGGRLRQRSPHLCLLDTAAGDSIHVELVPRAIHSFRWGKPAKVIAGATVDSIYDLGAGSCELQIPVSFRYAVSVFASSVGSDRKPVAGAACTLAETYAGTVITKLRTPGKARHAAGRPDLSKDACGVLIAAFAQVGSTAQDNGMRAQTGLDTCGVKAGDIGDAVLSLLVEPGPPEGGWGTKWRTIGGKDVYLGDDGCQWTWSEGSFADDDNRLISLMINDCTSADEQLAPKLVAAVVDGLGKPQPPATVSDLLYAPGEPTEPNPGACVDYQADQCEPAQQVAVPEGAGYLVEAALADQHVACAATVDAVRAQFPSLRPAVPQQAPTCAFVSPDHALTLSLQLQQGDDDYIGGEPDVQKPVTFAGHPGAYREHKLSKTSPAAASVCVDSGYARSDGGETWFWCFKAVFSTPRDEPGAKLDTSGAAKLVPMATAFAQRRLT